MKLYDILSSLSLILGFMALVMYPGIATVLVVLMGINLLIVLIAAWAVYQMPDAMEDTIVKTMRRKEEGIIDPRRYGAALVISMVCCVIAPHWILFAMLLTYTVIRHFFLKRIEEVYESYQDRFGPM